MVRVGIVGLANIGKSTLFNALTRTTLAQAANYPFCTIEPNKASCPIPDEKLEILAGIAESEKIVRSTVDFVDIAGLVRGASNGDGLGNKFLANIRDQVDVLIHVVRGFDDENISFSDDIDTEMDAVRDIETVNTELQLADLEVLERRRGGKAGKGPSLLEIDPLLEDAWLDDVAAALDGDFLPFYYMTVYFTILIIFNDDFGVFSQTDAPRCGRATTPRKKMGKARRRSVTQRRSCAVMRSRRSA